MNILKEILKASVEAVLLMTVLVSTAALFTILVVIVQNS